MYDSRLGSIVRRLLQWDIYDMSTHARCSDETALLKASEIVAIYCRSFCCLSSPVLSCGPGAEEDAVEIRGHYFAVVRSVAVNRIALKPWHAAIGNKYVETAVEFSDDLIDCFFDIQLRCHV
jgi:hypothetical protein